jgi:hypothetical protein
MHNTDTYTLHATRYTAKCFRAQLMISVGEWINLACQEQVGIAEAIDLADMSQIFTSGLNKIPHG